MDGNLLWTGDSQLWEDAKAQLFLQMEGNLLWMVDNRR
jgi:hypothetical protein